MITCIYIYDIHVYIMNVCDYKYMHVYICELIYTPYMCASVIVWRYGGGHPFEVHVT